MKLFPAMLNTSSSSEPPPDATVFPQSDLFGFELTRTDAGVGLILLPEMSLVVVLDSGKVLLKKLVAFSIKSILKSARIVTSNKTMANNIHVVFSTNPNIKGLSSLVLGMRNK